MLLALKNRIGSLAVYSVTRGGAGWGESIKTPPLAGSGVNMLTLTPPQTP